MRRGRLTGRLVGVSVVLLAAAALAAAWWMAPSADAGVAGDYRVEVMGPDGPVYDATVYVDEATATALGALLAAGVEGGFVVETEEYPGFRPCSVYVRSVGGHAAEGASGWTYEIGRGGERLHPAMGACAFPLRGGDVVHWSWTNGPA